MCIKTPFSLLSLSAGLLLALSSCQVENTSPLQFNPEEYSEKSLEVDGQTIHYRAFENILYVSNPVESTLQRFNFYVPVAYFEDEAGQNFTTETAPIFLPNNIGGYMPAEPGAPGNGRNGQPNAAAVALSKGYVVAYPGARGSTTQNADGTYIGKAPAAIVDLKAAVRYLRFNDDAMPGDAEKIISNGTSAGGALSALLGATGNNADYEPYLSTLGAANISDAIFAVSAYCPITNLDHADMAYEWQFYGYNEYTKMNFGRDENGQMQRSQTQSTLSTKEQHISYKLSTQFPNYLNSLELLSTNGSPLTLDDNGEGSFKEQIKQYVISAAQIALENGTDLSAHTWITIQHGTVTEIDYDAYLTYITRMKTPPAFDALDTRSRENQLFGTASKNMQHFTEFGLVNSRSETATTAS